MTGAFSDGVFRIKNQTANQPQFETMITHVNDEA